MLRSLQDLAGVPLYATDGEMGRISNFLFDDQSWMIRYLVVEVGNWFGRRYVVISVSAIDQPDWAAKTLRARLTREQVRNSPDVDSQKPVSRQQEAAMREYYGWPAYWDTGVNPEIPPIAVPVGREFPVHGNDDPHLRSADYMVGYQVWANDGEIARLEHFIVDDASWHIGYLDVRAGDWLHNRSMLIPTSWVKAISWADHHVELTRTR